MRLAAARRLTGVFRYRNYRLYAGANAVNLIGFWMQRVAIGWLTWELTGSTTWLGLMACAEFGPSLLLGPIAGTLADRFERLRLARRLLALLAMLATLLAGLALAALLNAPLLLLLVLLQGSLLACWQPVRLALVPSLVGREDLGPAVAINSVVFNGARFVGPGLAGVLLVHGHSGAVFALYALSVGVFWQALGRLRPADDAAPRAHPARLTAAVVEGWRYAAGHPGIGPCLLLLVVTCLCLRPVFELLPGFAAQVFERGAGGLAMLTAATGCGAVIGGLWLAQRGRIDGLSRVVIVAHLGLIGSLLVFVASSRFTVALAALGFAGLLLTVAGAGLQTLIQQAVDDAVRGRVLALYGMILRAGPSLGALAMGLAAERSGLPLPVLVGALLATIVWSTAWWRRRALAEVLEPAQALRGDRPSSG